MVRQVNIMIEGDRNHPDQIAAQCQNASDNTGLDKLVAGAGSSQSPTFLKTDLKSLFSFIFSELEKQLKNGFS